MFNNDMFSGKREIGRMGEMWAFGDQGGPH